MHHIQHRTTDHVYASLLRVPDSTSSAGVLDTYFTPTSHLLRLCRSRPPDLAILLIGSRRLQQPCSKCPGGGCMIARDSPAYRPRTLMSLCTVQYCVRYCLAYFGRARLSLATPPPAPAELVGFQAQEDLREYIAIGIGRGQLPRPTSTPAINRILPM